MKVVNLLIREMSKNLIHAFDAWFSQFDPRIATPYFNLCLVLWRSDCRIRRSGSHFVLMGGQRDWCLPHPLRSSWYRRGFDARVRELAETYSLSTIFGNLEAPTVVDCGANTGDIALYLPIECKYYGFEPDPLAYSCLEINIEQLTLEAGIYSLALSNFSGESRFYLSSKGADSSLVRPSNYTTAVSVEVATLDSMVARLGITHIDLLKVEAEGGEPEVLEGAMATLAFVDYVAVDAGPERNGRDTLPEVNRILTSAGFQMTVSNSKIGRFLYART